MFTDHISLNNSYIVSLMLIVIAIDIRKLNKIINLNIQHSMQLRIVTITVFLLYNQINSINFMFDKSETDNSGRALFILYILSIVFTHFIRSQKKEKKLTNQFGEEFLCYIKETKSSTNVN